MSLNRRWIRCLFANKDKIGGDNS